MLRDASWIRLVPFTAFVVVGSSLAQTTTRVSVDSGASQVTGPSSSPSVSSDGRYVAFESDASTLVAGDTNSASDVFVHDSGTGTTTRLSVDPGGLDGSAGSGSPSISADGRYVAFESLATNLIAGDTNGLSDIFVHDCQSGTTERVSVAFGGVQGNDGSFAPSISADGRYVAFGSWADNLVAGDTNGTSDVFVRDRQSGTIERVSVDSGGVQGNDFSSHPSISADGRYVAFDGDASNLVGGDGNVSSDVFVRDLQNGTTERVSMASGGVQGHDGSFAPSISADGRFVAFSGGSDNLVSGDTNGSSDSFVRDRQNGATERVSVSSSGAQGNGGSGSPAISGDGRYVTFFSFADNLVSGDVNGSSDVFVHDTQSGTTERVSVDSANQPGNAHSYMASTSVDGRYIAFVSAADNLVAGDSNGRNDVFLRDRGIPPPHSYCIAKTNSVGCLPSVGWSGAPSLSGPDNFFVTASNVLNNKTGLMFWSGAPANIPLFGGTRCVASPIIRSLGQNSGGNPPPNDCSGSYSFHFSHAYMNLHLLAPGDEVYCQFWSRDPGFAPPNNIGLTNGLRFTISP